MKEYLTQAEISAAVLVDDDTLVLFGRIDRPVPATATVHLDGEGEGSFLGRCWVDPASEERWFLAGIHVRGLARLRPKRLEIDGGPEGRIVLPRLAGIRTNPGLLVMAIEEDQPDQIGNALDFACSLLVETVSTPSARMARLLAALAEASAPADGFGEIFGRFHGQGLLIQGWTRSMFAAEQTFLIEGDSHHLYRTIVGSFTRADLDDGASGFTAVIPEALEQPEAIRRIYYRGRQGWRRLDIFESRTILPEGAALPHLRDMLDHLGDEPVVRALRRIASSQYEGIETMSRLGVPVRAALDLALRVPGHGVFVSGWLLDPTGQVGAVTLKGPGLAKRLDADWGRLARRDVSEAFAADPLFAGRMVPGWHLHGFMAFAAEPKGMPADAALHLELALADDSCAFLPVSAVLPSAGVIPRLLETVSLDDPAVERVVSRHVGPMVRAAAELRRQAARAACHSLGRELAEPRLSVVLPVTDGREDIDLNLARLAVDPDFAEVEILVVAGAQAHERLAYYTRRAADFYRLCIRFVTAPQAADAHEAVAAALPHARAERILLLSPSVLPTSRGWLSALERISMKSGRPAMVSPTLLYEDYSIRFAGIGAKEGPDGRTVYEARYAGYPRDWLRERDATTVDAATADCAFVPKRALAKALAAMAPYVGPEFKDLDLCLRLQAAGAVCVWLPSVALVALDEQPRPAHGEYWRQAGSLVDQWSFEEAWSAQAA